MKTPSLSVSSCLQRFISGSMLCVKARRRFGVLAWCVTLVAAASIANRASGQMPNDDLVQAEARVRAMRTELDAQWQSFAATLSSVTSAPDRIRRIDTWCVEQQPKMEALKAAEKEAGRLRQLAAPAIPQPSAPLPAVVDPLQADIMATDAEVLAEIRRINAEAADASDRIRWVDEFLALNRDALAQRDRNRVELARTLATPPRSNPAPTNETPRDSRVRELTSRIREIVDGAANLPPTERIAAIDAKAEELRRLEQELKALSKPN